MLGETIRLSVLATALAFAASIREPQAAALLADAAAATLAAALLAQAGPWRSDRSALILALSAAAVSAALMMIHGGAGLPLTVAAIAMGVGVITLAVQALARLAARWHRSLAHWLPVTLLLLASAAPFWLADAAGEQAASLLVGVSPLSYLATLADYDYLRSTFGYQHTVIGGLRYAYPPAPAVTLALLAAAGGIRLLIRQPGVFPSTQGEPG